MSRKFEILTHLIYVERTEVRLDWGRFEDLEDDESREDGAV